MAGVGRYLANLEKEAQGLSLLDRLIIHLERERERERDVLVELMWNSNGGPQVENQ
jgi:hypothetical protein